jgi:phosphoribosylformimino-5-aminoimidazole carboxamide ribotide isomerase
MEVIPVIDLKGGVVVRADRGLRDTYTPIKTPLAKTSAPKDVVAGLLALYPFRTIYVADLDAIEKRGSHDDTLVALEKTFPAVTFWVDPGIADSEAARSWLLRHPGMHLVLGSESLSDLAPLQALAGEKILLSLDFRGPVLLGPEGLYEAAPLWPERVILMTLDRVGSQAGPDLDRLSAILDLAPGKKIYAAGGLRGAVDLGPLARAGLAGVLVASALHDGRLTGADLAALETRDAKK